MNSLRTGYRWCGCGGQRKAAATECRSCYLSSASSLPERLWSKVAKGDGCWEWLGKRHESGYGLLRAPKSGHLRAHRVSWEIHNGTIPEGMVVCHVCDNPPCVRPDHLFLGTRGDNAADMRAKGRGRGPRLVGSTNPFAKASEAQVRAMRHLRGNGWTYPAIAAHLGLSVALVSQACSGRTWRHVS